MAKETNRCDREECFAHTLRGCSALANTYLKDSDCPFFKTRTQLREERKDEQK